MAKAWDVPRFSMNGPFENSLRQVLATRFDEIFVYEHGARAGDPDAVHDMRVAVRRLLAMIAVFKARLPYGELKNYTRRLKKVAALLGKVREHDVYLRYLEQRRETADCEAVRHMRIRQMLRRNRRQAQLRAELLRLKPVQFRRDVFAILAKGV